MFACPNREEKVVSSGGSRCANKGSREARTGWSKCSPFRTQDWRQTEGKTTYRATIGEITRPFLQVLQTENRIKREGKNGSWAKVFVFNLLLCTSNTFCSYRTFPADDRGRFVVNLNCAELEKGVGGCVVTLSKIRGIFIRR